MGTITIDDRLKMIDDRQQLIAIDDREKKLNIIYIYLHQEITK